jgi:hypothetical protein
MKPTRFIAFLIVLTLGGLVGGCGKEGPKHSESSTDDAHAEGHDEHGTEGHDDHDEEGGESSASFKAGTGLAFPPEVLAAMGVSTAEVEERLLPLTIDLVAQVYATLPSPRAVALVSPASARNLTVGLSASLPDAVGQVGSTAATARLTEIPRTLETAAHQVELIFNLAARPEPYQLGETLKLRLRIAPDTPRVTVPRAAVLDTALGTFVYVVNGEAFLRTPVTTGAMDHDTVEITDGVFEGDTVVISPVSQLWLTELRLTKGGGHSH